MKKSFWSQLYVGFVPVIFSITSMDARAQVVRNSSFHMSQIGFAIPRILGPLQSDSSIPSDKMGRFKSALVDVQSSLPDGTSAERIVPGFPALLKVILAACTDAYLYHASASVPVVQRFFGSMNVGSVSAPPVAAVEAMIQNLSQMWWGRNATPQEVAPLTGLFVSTGPNGPLGVSQYPNHQTAVISVCAAIGMAPESIGSIN